MITKNDLAEKHISFGTYSSSSNLNINISVTSCSFVADE